MRVLRISQNIKTGERAGGGAYHIHALSRDQAKLGHEVTVLTTGDSKHSSLIEGEGWQYQHVNYGVSIKLLGNNLSLDFIRDPPNFRNFDIIHLHTHLYFTNLLTSVMNVFSDIPVVITNHGLYSASLPLWISKLQLRTLGRMVYSQADKVFCYTCHDRDKLQSLGIRTPIKVIHNGIDTSMFCPGTSTSGPLENDSTNLLFVGRLVQGKRPMFVLRAFSQIADQFPDAQLYVCGDGPLYPELNKFIHENKLEQNAHLLGEIPYQNMPNVYRGADILILPTQTEGFPRTILESLASGVPVITTDLPQLEPVVSHGGVTFRGNNPGQLSSKISLLLENEVLRNRLGRQGHSLVNNQYTFESLVKKTTSEMENLTNLFR